MTPNYNYYQNLATLVGTLDTVQMFHKIMIFMTQFVCSSVGVYGKSNLGLSRLWALICSVCFSFVFIGSSGNPKQKSKNNTTQMGVYTRASSCVFTEGSNFVSDIAFMNKCHVNLCTEVIKIKVQLIVMKYF